MYITSESLPRERFWDIQVSKIDSQTRRLLCPSRPASAPLRHTLASSVLATQCYLKWLDGVLDAYAASPLAQGTPGMLRAAARLLGTTDLRFALHGRQRSKRNSGADSSIPPGGSRKSLSSACPHLQIGFGQKERSTLYLSPVWGPSGNSIAIGLWAPCSLLCNMVPVISPVLPKARSRSRLFSIIAQ